MAAHVYNLELLPSSNECHDAQTNDGRMVQIKATQVNSVALYGEPKYLIVLHLKTDGSHTEIYNGPGRKPWNESGPVQKNGQRRISLAKLRTLMEKVHPDQRIQRIVP